ncbi:MAG: DUF4956 domain-containing protein [Clostridia bacterium]|nr:DUF4956 domain-containing protein [Clostridia bacterium]
MFADLSKGLFDSATDFLRCLGTALACGLLFSLCHMFRSRYTKSFAITLLILPAVVCAVIMMVNGNVGTGVAVAGAFSLVRFRSVPGTAKEITMLFLAMGAGLICGTGHLAFAVLYTLVLGLVFLLCNQLPLASGKKSLLYKTLTITIPEDLDYSGIFDDLFKTYTREHSLIRVKTTNMGSLFRLTYHITLKANISEKQFIDELRCRNGNLEISMSQQETTAEL